MMDIKWMNKRNTENKNEDNGHRKKHIYKTHKYNAL